MVSRILGEENGVAVGDDVHSKTSLINVLLSGPSSPWTNALTFTSSNPPLPINSCKSTNPPATRSIRGAAVTRRVFWASRARFWTSSSYFAFLSSVWRAWICVEKLVWDCENKQRRKSDASFHVVRGGKESAPALVVACTK